MAYRVMQNTEDGMDFCAQGGFATWEAADQWIDTNANQWPESRFYVESEQCYHHEYHDDPYLDDVPW
jgi:hypothetical protein